MRKLTLDLQFFFLAKNCSEFHENYETFQSPELCVKAAQRDGCGLAMQGFLEFQKNTYKHDPPTVELRVPLDVPKPVAASYDNCVGQRSCSCNTTGNLRIT
jgi:predicted GNAT superfamily acetyltransferase